MKSRIMLVLVGALSLVMVQGVRAGEPESEKGGVVGTWYTNVTLRNCQTGAEIRSFPALNTFGPGGTLIDTTTATSPAFRSPGHGAWEKTGADTYNAVSWAFLFSPAGVWVAGLRKSRKKSQSRTVSMRVPHRARSSARTGICSLPAAPQRWRPGLNRRRSSH